MSVTSSSGGPSGSANATSARVASQKAASATLVAGTETASVVALDRTRAIAQQRTGAASVAAQLLASLASRASDAFSDKTTLVGSLSAAQAAFSIAGQGASNQSAPSQSVHKPAASFTVALAKASLPVPPASVTQAQAVSRYAESARSGTAA